VRLVLRLRHRAPRPPQVELVQPPARVAEHRLRAGRRPLIACRARRALPDDARALDGANARMLEMSAQCDRDGQSAHSGSSLKCQKASLCRQICKESEHSDERG